MLRRRKWGTTTPRQSTGKRWRTGLNAGCGSLQYCPFNRERLIWTSPARRHKASAKDIDILFLSPNTRFRMKCHLCVNYIEMQTDPATCDYLIVSGARRKEERWDMAENEQILTTGERIHVCHQSEDICFARFSNLSWKSAPGQWRRSFFCFHHAVSNAEPIFVFSVSCGFASQGWCYLFARTQSASVLCFLLLID